MSSAPFTTVTNDRLVYMLFLATLFHGVLIMGITFRDQLADLSIRPLEVVLVGSGPSTEASERARYIAERNTRGESGGADDETVLAGELSTGDPFDNDGTLGGRALTPSQEGRPAARDDVIVSPSPATSRVPSVTAPMRPDPATLQARLMRAAPANDTLSSDLGVSRGNGPRERTVSVDTQEALFASYLAAWKMRVEQLGTLNFPDAARRAGLSGNPVLEVAIDADGGLREIIVVRSSQQKLLDQAALRILRLAAPFEPFPEDLRREYDVLRFVYEWRFIGQQAVAQR